MSRPILVSCLNHARTALTVAEELGRPVTLLSSPGGCALFGPLFFREMIARAASERPAAVFDFVLDCGEDTGTALQALRLGITTVHLEAPPETLRRVEDMAAQRGARLERTLETALDLEGEKNAELACRSWLLGSPS